VTGKHGQPDLACDLRIFNPENARPVMVRVPWYPINQKDFYEELLADDLPGSP
jgi:hypothetical protein